MIDGALSVGMLDSRGALPSISDEENQELKYQDLLSDLDDLEVSREKFRVSNYTSFIGNNSLPTSQALTGFLLRSTVVRDYPGIEVSAFDAPNVGPENDDRWARKRIEFKLSDRFDYQKQFYFAYSQEYPLIYGFKSQVKVFDWDLILTIVTNVDMI